MSDDNKNQTGDDLVKAGQAATLKAEQEAQAREALEFEQDMKEKLRENGKLLGITFGPNEGVPSMIKKLKDAREQIFMDPADAEILAAKPKSYQEELNEMRMEELKLIRIQIACVNPNKAGLPGEIFTVHNDVVGTVKKFIPYNEAGEAYHVPNILFKFLKGKKFLQIKDPPKGSRASATSKLVPEFAITLLPPLTEEELKELARAQGAAEAADGV